MVPTHTNGISMAADGAGKKFFLTSHVSSLDTQHYGQNTLACHGYRLMVLNFQLKAEILFFFLRL